MKILVIGAGSIGKRHAKCASDISGDVMVFDHDEMRAKETGLKTFHSLDEALAWKPDGVVVATPHKTHLDIARRALDSGARVLVEKPLSHSMEGVDEFVALAKGRAFVVCNMRFHPAIKALRENIEKVGDVHYARAQYGNYLPNMRPDADYKKLYCAHKDQGGGVILDAIHEIDYLSWLFGPVSSVAAEAARRGNLEVDVEDYASLILRHENGVHSEIHLDYLQQCKRRGCEIAGSKGTLVWLSEGKKPEHCSVRLYRDNWKTVFESTDLDASSMYYDTMTAFIDELGTSGSRPDLLNVQDAAVALRVALSARKSAETGRRIGMNHGKTTDKNRKQRIAL